MEPIVTRPSPPAAPADVSVLDSTARSQRLGSGQLHANEASRVVERVAIGVIIDYLSISWLTLEL